MSRLLNQLGNDREAILLLYLAGELSDAESSTVEARLRSDPAMQRIMDELRTASERFERNMDALDASQAPAVGDVVARRQVASIVRQWQADKFRAVEESDGPSARGRWWKYPGAAAAILLLGLLVWWGNTPPDNLPVAVGPSTGPSMNFSNQDLLVAQHLRQSFGTILSDETIAPLDQVEAELLAMNDTPMDVFGGVDQ